MKVEVIERQGQITPDMYENYKLVVRKEDDLVLVFSEELRKIMFERLLSRLKCTSQEFFDPDTELTFETETYELYLEELADYLGVSCEENGEPFFDDDYELDEIPGMIVLELAIALKNKIFYLGNDNSGVYYVE